MTFNIADFKRGKDKTKRKSRLSGALSTAAKVGAGAAIYAQRKNLKSLGTRVASKIDDYAFKKKYGPNAQRRVRGLLEDGRELSNRRAQESLKARPTYKPDDVYQPTDRGLYSKSNPKNKPKKDKKPRNIPIE